MPKYMSCVLGLVAKWKIPIRIIQAWVFRLEKHLEGMYGGSLFCYDGQESTTDSHIHKQKAAAPAVIMHVSQLSHIEV